MDWFTQTKQRYRRLLNYFRQKNTSASVNESKEARLKKTVSLSAPAFDELTVAEDPCDASRKELALELDDCCCDV